MTRLDAAQVTANIRNKINLLHLDKFALNVI